MSNDYNVKYVTPTGLKKSFQSFLDKLKGWLPIKKTENSVIITTPQYKNVVEIRENGMIYIIGTNNDNISLQQQINSNKTEIVKSYVYALNFASVENIGKFIYVEEDTINPDTNNIEYSSGLYVVSGIWGTSPLEVTVSKLGTTSAVEKDMGERVEALEHFVQNPLGKDEINNILNKQQTN